MCDWWKQYSENIAAFGPRASERTYSACFAESFVYGEYQCLWNSGFGVPVSCSGCRSAAKFFASGGIQALGFCVEASACGLAGFTYVAA